MKNGTLECSVCHSKLVSPNSRTYSKAYDRHKIRVSSKQRALNVLLVVGDCVLVGLQVISCRHDLSLSLPLSSNMSSFEYSLLEIGMGKLSYRSVCYFSMFTELCFAD